MQCDVIIPTYNSAAVLPQALEALFGQAIPAGWQCRLLLTDDGSIDATIAVAEPLCQDSGWEYVILQNKHGGRAYNRNRALARASAHVILFLQADILLRPGALTEHLRFHEQHPSNNQAALGHIAWDPRLKPSALMEWLTHSGPQNDFDTLLGRRQVPVPQYFYGANLSLKRSLLRSERFAESFQQYGWEDYELGVRLARHGLELVFLEDALALHRHTYTVSDVKNRQLAVGQELHQVKQRHPSEELPRRKMLAQRWKYRLASVGGLVAFLRLLITMWPRLSWPWAFKVVTTAWFWEGYLKGLIKAK